MSNKTVTVTFERLWGRKRDLEIYGSGDERDALVTDDGGATGFFDLDRERQLDVLHALMLRVLDKEKT